MAAAKDPSFVCTHCRRKFFDRKEDNRCNDDTNRCCVVCLGLFATATTSSEQNTDDGAINTILVQKLKLAIEESMRPYVDNGNVQQKNLWSRRVDPPTIALPGDLIHRFQWYTKQQQQQQCKMSEDNNPSVVLVEEFAEAAKRKSRTLLQSALDQIILPPSNDDATIISNSDDNDAETNNIALREEQGYLTLHVVAVPCTGICRPPHLKNALSSKAKPRISRRNRMRRHDDPAPTGGDPRLLLTQRISKRKGNNNMPIWSMSHCLKELQNQSEQPPVRRYDSEETTEEDWPLIPATNTANTDTAAATAKDASFSCGLDFFVAVWRRPFAIASCYTKLRRDVSQTPFFVTDNSKRRRLGISSVEEQIVPVILEHCGGLATHNANYNNDDCTNDDDDDTNNNHANNNGRTGLEYASAKFHASGREDMDVRMLLPDNNNINNDNGNGPVITGRPFVVQVTDALRMPGSNDLAAMVDGINNNNSNRGSESAPCAPATSDQPPSGPTPWARSYGRNAMASIGPDLKFCSTTAFQTLQADTEEKSKHYGCLCWSARPLPKDNDETNSLQDLLWGNRKTPLDIVQRTPLRVLHRRSNLERPRQILSLRAIRIDEHYFRLHLSTTAGTYVKEFVHGDMGRTIPSIASILGCKTDILELDCEGIQLCS